MKIVTEFTVAEGKHYWVTVKAWPSAKYDYNLKRDGDKWNWNVYAHISEKHVLFPQVDRCVQELHFNGGCTLDQIKTIEPATGIQYDFQKASKVCTYGSDYAHIHDDYDNHPAPSEGIPSYVLRDAETLAAQLERITTEEQSK